MHHNDDRIKDFKCDMCEKAYFANIDLQRHIDTIFPFDTIQHYAFFTACDNSSSIGTAGGLGTVCLNSAQGMHHK